MCCGKGQCSHLNCSWCHACKTICLMTCGAEAACPLFAPCCKPLCCVNNSAPQFPHPKEVARTKIFNGHPIEDIRDPKYLDWPARQPTGGAPEIPEFSR